MILFKHKLCQAVKDDSGGGSTAKKVKINGKEIDYADLLLMALRDAHSWALSQGLSAELENAFNLALSDTLEGIGNGDRYENGRYYGKTKNLVEYYGKYSGEKKDGGSRAWNGIKRNGYDAYGNVVAYLNGKSAGITSTSLKTETANTPTKKAWNNNAFQTHVYRRLFGLAPEGTTDLNTWADSFGDSDKFNQTTGKRGIEGRRAELTRVLADMNLDDYDGLSDEDKNLYKSFLQKDLNGLISADNLKRLGLGALLFDTEKYLGKPLSDEEKKAKEAEEKAKALKEKEELLTTNYNNWMNLTYDINSAKSYDLLYDPNITSDDNEFIDDLISSGYGWDNFLNGLNTDLSSNYAGLNMDSYYSRKNEYDTSDLDRWNYDMTQHEGIFGKLFIEYFNPNKRSFWSTDIGDPNINPLQYRLMAYNNMLYGLMRNGLLDKYKVGTNSYALVDSMDKDGNMLVYNYSNGKPSITKTNIRAFKNLAKNPDLKEMWDEVAKRYAKLNNVDLNTSQQDNNTFLLQFNKAGGVLKYELGAEMVARRKEQEALDTRSSAEKEKEKLDNRKISKGLTGTDALRLGALAADLTSAVAAWAPGVGTGVSLATGLTATGANFAADIAEGDSNALKNLLVGAGMDVVGSVAGLGAGAKGSKIITNLVKWAPRLMTLATAYNMAPEFTLTLSKVVDGKAKLTAKDLRILARGTAALAGVSRMGAGVYNKAAIDNAARTGKFTAQVKGKNGEMKTITLNKDLASKLSAAKTKAEADAIVKGVDDKATSLFTDKLEFGWKKPSSWISRSKNDSGVLEQFDYSRVVENPKASWGWVDNLALFYSKFGLDLNKTNLDRYLAARNIQIGNDVSSSRFSTKPEKTNALHGKNVSDLRKLASDVAREVKFFETHSGLKVDNVRNFRRYLDSAKARGYSQRDYLDMLSDPYMARLMKLLGKFKEGGRIVPMFKNPFSAFWEWFTTPTYNPQKLLKLEQLTSTNPPTEAKAASATYNGKPTVTNVNKVKQDNSLMGSEQASDTKPENTVLPKPEGLPDKIHITPLMLGGITVPKMKLDAGVANFRSNGNDVLSEANKHAKPGEERKLDILNYGNVTLPTDYSKNTIPEGKTDYLPTALELAKYLGTSFTNKSIDDIKLKPVSKIFQQEDYRHHGQYDYLTQATQQASNLMHTGNMIANATTDLGAGTAALLNSQLKALGLISEGQRQYNNTVLQSEANAIATANRNEGYRVPVANENSAAVVAADNQEKVKHMQYLNKQNANNTNLLNTIIYGHQLGAQQRYQNAYNNYLMSQPEWNKYNEYTQRISNKISLNPLFDWSKPSEGWTQEDVNGFILSQNAINKAGNLWKQRNNPTMPYAFAWFKSGGKMAEAERVKNQRAAARLFFDTVKHTNNMSRLAIKDSSASSLYLLKRMMQGK